MDDELETLKESLLARLEVKLGPEDGDEAFERHVLLAIRIDMTARVCSLNWNQFFRHYFPEGRNSGTDASLLWTRWRQGLVKELSPGAGVAITHGHPNQHWQRDDRGALWIDLESMWADYKHAVDRLIDAARSDDSLRTTSLDNWAKRTWVVRPFGLLPPLLTNRGGSRIGGFLPVGTAMARIDTPAASARPYTVDE